MNALRTVTAAIMLVLLIPISASYGQIVATLVGLVAVWLIPGCAFCSKS